MNIADLSKLSTQSFTKSLDSFCQKYGYTFNPKIFQDNYGRIQQYFDNKTRDMIYIQTNKDTEFEVETKTSVELALPF